mgnify:CR=1 FL=1
MVVAALVLATMGAISVGFLLFMLATSNPFERQFPVPAEGRDLNPLLQDPGLIIHPPMLYMGYVGFSVAFSFAIAALITGKLDLAWARWTRPWTTTAWLFLTMGITLGSWWAYYELGWGGWWFWDPVENASFMPWLVGTALIHSLAVTEKRGVLKSWTVLLAILAFALSLLGTFLVRSGVLVSVHAFATDPARGVFILAFLTIVLGAALLLYAWRAPRLVSDGAVQLVSREGLLLLNNVFLVAAAAAVLIGTLYPLVIDALGLGKISVGPPYFNAIFLPLMVPLAVLAPGIEPFVGLAVWLEAHKRNEMIFRPSQDAHPIMRGATSVGQLLELLGPLFAILLGFTGFAQDRQRGTLRMAMGNGGRPARMLLVRFGVHTRNVPLAADVPLDLLIGASRNVEGCSTCGCENDALDCHELAAPDRGSGSLRAPRR